MFGLYEKDRLVCHLISNRMLYLPSHFIKPHKACDYVQWESTCLHPSFPVLVNISSTYFCYDIKILCQECATSMLGKYFNLSSSLISNSCNRHLCNAYIFCKSSLVTTMLSA